MRKSKHKVVLVKDLKYTTITTDNQIADSLLKRLYNSFKSLFQREKLNENSNNS